MFEWLSTYQVIFRITLQNGRRFIEETGEDPKKIIVMLEETGSSSSDNTQCSPVVGDVPIGISVEIDRNF